MYFNGNITFKGVSSSTHSLLVTTVPTITHSEIKDEPLSIPGRDGDLHSDSPYRGDAQIKVTFALIKETGNYHEAIRGVRQWLTGTGKLIIGDATDAYYEVKKVVLNTDERLVLNVGTIEAIFTVYPYEFLDSGDTETSNTTIVNTHSPSMPLYKITGNGSGTLELSGSGSMTFTVAGTLYIDTRNLIAYDASSPVQDKSASVGGDYTKLRLKTGTNTLSITNGFTLKTKPRWGCEI